MWQIFSNRIVSNFSTKALAMPYVPYSVWPNACTQSGHLAAIKHYKSPIASLIYELSFKVYLALLGLISFTRYVDDAKPKMQLDVCCLSGSGLFLGAI